MGTTQVENKRDAVLDAIMASEAAARSPLQEGSKGPGDGRGRLQAFRERVRAKEEQRRQQEAEGRRQAAQHRQAYEAELEGARRRALARRVEERPRRPSPHPFG